MATLGFARGSSSKMIGKKGFDVLLCAPCFVLQANEVPNQAAKAFYKKGPTTTSGCLKELKWLAQEAQEAQIARPIFIGLRAF